jgi:putative sterol carrier protein
MTTTEMTLTESPLLQSLYDFRKRFNDSERVKKLIKNWDRAIMLESIDSNNNYSFTIENNELSQILPGLVEKDPMIHLQAEESILTRIFSGDYNPASALIDGALAVFSDERDKVKLEAIAMIIWGM